MDGTERMYGGILRAVSGEMKAVIPATHEAFVNGVLDLAEYNGQTWHDHMDSLDGTELSFALGDRRGYG